MLDSLLKKGTNIGERSEMLNPHDRYQWLRREVCDMITFCELNSLFMMREALLMSLVNLNLDEEAKIMNETNVTTDNLALVD